MTRWQKLRQMPWGERWLLLQASLLLVYAKIRLPFVGWTGQDFQLCQTLAPVAHSRADAIRAGVTATHDNHMLVFSRDVLAVLVA